MIAGMELVDMINNWKDQPWAREMGFSNDCQSSNTCLMSPRIRDNYCRAKIKWQHTTPLHITPAAPRLLWLAESDHMTWILASHWLRETPHSTLTPISPRHNPGPGWQGSVEDKFVNFNVCRPRVVAGVPSCRGEILSELSAGNKRPLILLPVLILYPVSHNPAAQIETLFDNHTKDIISAIQEN